MCIEGKRMGMVMGEAKAAQPAEQNPPVAAASETGKADIAARIEQKISEDEETTVELPADERPLLDPEGKLVEDTSEKESADRPEETAQEDNPSEKDKEAPTAQEVQAIVIEAAEMHMLCPLIVEMGSRTSFIFDYRVERGDFENDEDDIIIDLLKRMYRAEEYFEALELLELVFLMTDSDEPLWLLDVARGMGDPECCKLFLNGFINESSRSDLEILRRNISGHAEETDEVNKDE